jgi:hypothetical protein
MTSIITKPDSSQSDAETAPQPFDDWFDPIETEVRDRARQLTEDSQGVRHCGGASASRTGQDGRA